MVCIRKNSHQDFSHKTKKLAGQKWSESTQIMSETTNAFLDNIVEGNMKVREYMSNLISTLEVVYLHDPIYYVCN